MMNEPFLSECQVCFAMVRPMRLLNHTNWHKWLKRSLERGGLVEQEED